MNSKPMDDSSSEPDPKMVQCPSDVLDGLISQLNTKKAWKRYLKGAFADECAIHVAESNIVQRTLFIAIGHSGNQYCVAEIKHTMKLWEKAFCGKVHLYIGILEEVEL